MISGSNSILVAELDPPTDYFIAECFLIKKISCILLIDSWCDHGFRFIILSLLFPVYSLNGVIFARKPDIENRMPSIESMTRTR